VRGCRQFGAPWNWLPAVLTVAMMLGGCETNQDPRAGGFVEGVTNLSTGGYDAYLRERRAGLHGSQDEANILDERARSIAAERDALESELRAASDELTRLQQRLSTLQRALTSTRQQSAAEKQKFEEANRRAASARERIDALQRNMPAAIGTRRESIDDLKTLIGSVAAMVEELSG
jgi:chromosome segregation ATPase